ncbi:DUF7019 family protein [Streptomyces albidocamelliae]|uniref:Uncharacterized protein n=1 Tax=Streptomyces albidocamelliae TaxID=2981135 RepID=A0ABY6EU01_9ACTN|nr:hypothetical protein [Streptomyces sp. HUAS 14-6]UXY37825.1 hypothetical protein N8I86_25675 [Streptomyces sp. HUAS 14-6]
MSVCAPANVMNGRQGRMVSSGSEVGRYVYWSDRAIQRVAEENGIELAGRRTWTVGVSVPGLQSSFGQQTRVTRNRLEEARRVKRHIGTAAVEDLDTEPPASYITGVGKVEFAEFAAWHAQGGVVMHVQLRSANGRRVDLCLFGSKDNLRGFGPSDGFDNGWTSSAAPAIEELLRSRGTQNTSQWDDEQARSVEALKIALDQGFSSISGEHVGRPETRGFTIGHAGDCEFFAEIYTDVVLDPTRWRLEGESAGAERIMVGRPMWIRTQSPDAVVRYAELRNGSGWSRHRWLRPLRFLSRRRRAVIGPPAAVPTALDTPESSTAGAARRRRFTQARD